MKSAGIVIWSIALALSLGACGSSDNSSDNDDENNGTPEEPSAPEESAGVSPVPNDHSLTAGGTGVYVVPEDDGRLVGWGAGRLGDGSTADTGTPAVIDADNTWLAVGRSANHGTAVRSDGTVWSWDTNFADQFASGPGTLSSSETPVQMCAEYSTTCDSFFSGAVDIDVGESTTVIAREDGTVWAAGGSGYGGLGDGTNETTADKVFDGGDAVPNQVCRDTCPTMLDNVTAVAAGFYHNLALREDGTLWSWGNNDHGQLGQGAVGDQNTAGQVGTDSDWAAIAAGGYTSLGVKTDGTLWVWGKNDSGQLGDDCTVGADCADSDEPTRVGSATDWAVGAVGEDHVIALKTDGSLWAWGANYSGQLGDGCTVGTDCTASSTPAQVGSDSDWEAIAAGCCSNLARKADGSYWTWGDNGVGQLGDGCDPTLNGDCAHRSTLAEVTLP